MNTTDTKRPRKCPVGTTREWEKGRVIKLHEGNVFHSGWYLVPAFPSIEKISKQLDDLAKQFVRVREPVSGETFLDEIIKNYKRPEGEDQGPFNPADFKQYKGYYGALDYSFYNEFTKRAMAVQQSMQTEIQEQLMSKSGGSKANITEDEIQSIKDAVRAQYKVQMEREVDVSEFQRLHDVIVEQWKFLNKSTQLSEEDQKVVADIKNQLQRLEKGNTKDKIDGEGYFDAVEMVNALKTLCIDHFSGNWLLLQTQLDLIETRFQNYLKRYSGEITQVIRDYSVKAFNIDVLGDTDTFYSELQRKILSSNTKQYPSVEKLFNGNYTIQLPTGETGNIYVRYEYNEKGAEQQTPFDYGRDNWYVISDNEDLIRKLQPYLSVFKFIKDGDKFELHYNNTLNKKNISQLPEQVDRGSQSLVNLLSLTEKLPKPETVDGVIYKKAYLLGRKVRSFYKGKKMSFILDYKKDTSFSKPIALQSKPVIHLDNIEDAKKVKDIFLNKLIETGFNKEEAEQEFDDYVKTNEFPLDKYDLNIILTDLGNNNMFEKAKLDFKPLLKMRFNGKYNKDLEGDWNSTNVYSLNAIEHVIDELPQGHVITNDKLKEFMYDADYSKQYACYMPDPKRILFSDDCLRSTSKQLERDGRSYFRSVVVHEIGHAVSEKYGRENNIDYRHFVNECGWSYLTDRAKDDSTGGDIAIGRSGKNSVIPLLTDYSHQSPEEAFAEYYSFYHNNKQHIDKWLEIGDDNILKQYHVTNPSKKKLTFQNLTLEQHPVLNNIYNNAIINENDLKKLKDHFTDNNFTKQLDLAVESINPWQCSYIKSPNVELTRMYIENGRGNEDSPPVFLIKNVDGTTEPLHCDNLMFKGNGTSQTNILEGNRYLQRNVPAITISRRSYDKLQQEYDDSSIATMLADLHRTDLIPHAQPITKDSDKITGLYYDAKVVDYNTIRKNQGALRQMKKIYESDSLKKALNNLFGDDEEEKRSFQKSLGNLFEPFVTYLKSIIGNNKKKTNIKRNYADVIIITDDLKVLLCVRDKNDDFMPGMLCLPGGKIEKDESAKDAVIRECGEEINYPLDENKLIYITAIENLDLTKSYYFAYLGGSEFEIKGKIVLDAAEQNNYMFMSLDKIITAQVDKSLFILDLRERLKHLLENFDVIEKVFDTPEEKQTIPLFDETQNINSPFSAIRVLGSKFDNGEIEEDKFVQDLIDNKQWIV